MEPRKTTFERIVDGHRRKRYDLCTMLNPGRVKSGRLPKRTILIFLGRRGGIRGGIEATQLAVGTLDPKYRPRLVHLGVTQKKRKRNFSNSGSGGTGMED